MKLAGTLLFAGVLALGTAVAQDSTTTSSQPGAKQDMKDAGHDTKEAGKDVGHATTKTAKKVGSTTKNTSKKVVNKGAQKTDQGATKVEDKTAPQQ